MRGRMGRDLLLCIIRVMECGWGLHEVMVMWLIRRGRLYFGLGRRSPIILLLVQFYLRGRCSFLFNNVGRPQAFKVTYDISLSGTAIRYCSIFCMN